MMGVGKTTIGKVLSRKLNMPLVDSDKEIVDASGYSIEEYFEKFGEKAFREGEHLVIKRLLEKKEPFILSLGGGAFLHSKTRSLIQEKAYSIWLVASIETLLERAKKNSNRPLLNQAKNPTIFLKDKLEERKDIYALADCHIETDGKNLDTIADQIIQEVNNF